MFKTTSRLQYNNFNLFYNLYRFDYLKKNHLKLLRIKFNRQTTRILYYIHILLYDDNLLFV